MAAGLDNETERKEQESFLKFKNFFFIYFFYFGEGYGLNFLSMGQDFINLFVL